MSLGIVIDVASGQPQATKHGKRCFGYRSTSKRPRSDTGCRRCVPRDRDPRCFRWLHRRCEADGARSAGYLWRGSQLPTRGHQTLLSPNSPGLTQNPQHIQRSSRRVLGPSKGSTIYGPRPIPHLANVCPVSAAGTSASDGMRSDWRTMPPMPMVEFTRNFSSSRPARSNFPCNTLLTRRTGTLTFSNTLSSPLRTGLGNDCLIDFGNRPKQYGVDAIVKPEDGTVDGFPRVGNRRCAVFIQVGFFSFHRLPLDFIVSHCGRNSWLWPLPVVGGAAGQQRDGRSHKKKGQQRL